MLEFFCLQIILIHYLIPLSTSFPRVVQNPEHLKISFIYSIYSIFLKIFQSVLHFYLVLVNPLALFHLFFYSLPNCLSYFIMCYTSLLFLMGLLGDKKLLHFITKCMRDKYLSLKYIIYT